MSTRAKFFVSAIKRYTYGDSIEVTLNAVTRKTDDNKDFWTATPSGSITMAINNKAAWPTFLEAFEKGTDLYVDFTPVPPEA